MPQISFFKKRILFPRIRSIFCEICDKSQYSYEDNVQILENYKLVLKSYYLFIL